MTTKMVVRQPEVVMHTTDSNDWGSGIFDCCEDQRDCCFACWCGPCYACKVSREYDQPLCFPLLACWINVNMVFRVTMREKYKIRGTWCQDCKYAVCCTACSWCQMRKEIRRRKIPIVLISNKATS